MNTEFYVAPDRAYFRIRAVTRNERGEIQRAVDATHKRYDTQELAEQAIVDLAEGRTP